MTSTETYMDKGYAWIILCASFLNVTLVAGTIRTFGILYAELLEVYDGGSGNTAFMGSLLLFTFAITNPVAGFVSVHYSFKWCTVIGGMLAGIGMTMSSLTTNVELLLLTYSFVLGVGLGLTYPSAFMIINFYFEKRRAFANGFLSASLGLASLVYPVLYRKLIDNYGIHGTMLILGGMLLNICVGGSLYRQPKCFVSSNVKVKDDNHQFTLNLNKKTGICFNIRLQLIGMLKAYLMALKNHSFILYCIATSFAMVAYSSNFNMLPPRIISQHFTKEDAVIAITVIGGTEFVARFFSGYLLDLNHFSVQTMFIVTMFMGGLFSIAFTFFRSRVVNIIYAVTVGIFPGVLHSITPLLLVSILGLKNLPTAVPLSSLFYNAACLIGHPFLGWLEDWTGNWNASFYTMGGFLITSSICVMIERALWKLRADNTIMEINADDTNILENKENNNEERKAMLDKNQNGSV